MQVTVRRAAACAVALVLAATGLAAQDDVAAQRAAREADEYERNLLADLLQDYVDNGQAFYEGGRRREAIWCWERAIQIRPDWTALHSFVARLQDFDNPIWKKKHWKSPRESADAAFRKRQEQLDGRHLAKLLQIGVHHFGSRDAIVQERAHARFLDALKIAGGPYATDAEGRLLVGKAGAIPEVASKRLIDEDLVLINGKRWLRDSMLRSLGDVSSVLEARGNHFLVRTVTTLEQAKELLSVMEQAWPEYVDQTGAEPRELLGLFVFADKATYQEYCKKSKHEKFTNAVGFANNGEGFAVTFAQAGVAKTAVHEGAHLFHHAAFETTLPSWYEEGFACFFGHDGSMRWRELKLTTRLAPTKALVAPFVSGARPPLPLEEVLRGDAAELIAAGAASVTDFYLESWLLYSFLTSTKDPRIARPFAEWEGFCLGAGYHEETRGADASRLFERLFTGKMAELEKAFLEWMAALE